MFLVTWLFDKVGYMPKISIDTQWPFPAVQKDYVAPEFEKKIARKTVKKATTRKTPKK
jgi:hypothetical protein